MSYIVTLTEAEAAAEYIPETQVRQTHARAAINAITAAAHPGNLMTEIVEKGLAGEGRRIEKDVNSALTRYVYDGHAGCNFRTCRAPGAGWNANLLICG